MPVPDMALVVKVVPELAHVPVWLDFTILSALRGVQEMATAVGTVHVMTAHPAMESAHATLDITTPVALRSVQETAIAVGTGHVMMEFPVPEPVLAPRVFLVLIVRHREKYAIYR